MRNSRVLASLLLSQHIQHPIMACLASLNGVSETLAIKQKPFNATSTRRRMTIIGFGGNKTEEIQENKSKVLASNSGAVQTTRRAVFGLAAITISAQIAVEKSLAEDNGYWITSLIPIPPIYNKIANEETGTRSFIKNGIWIPDIGIKGRIYRVKKYAFELTGMGDLIGQDALNYLRRYLRIKATPMYYDFDKIISAAPANDKQPLTDLANRLFDSMEKLEDAAKKNNRPLTESCYQDTTTLLQEVMTRMA